MRRYIKGLKKRRWERCLNMHGNDLGAQIVEESGDLLDIMDAVKSGMPRPADLFLQLVAASTSSAFKSTAKRVAKGIGRACGGCGRSESDIAAAGEGKLTACGHCKIALYCGRDCQVLDWKRGHKAVCVVV